MSKDNKDSRATGEPENVDQDEVKRRVRNYDSRIFDEQLRQAQLLSSSSSHPHQVQEHPVPNLFPHQSYPINAAQSAGYAAGYIPPQMERLSQSAPSIQRQHPQHLNQPTFHPPFRSLSNKILPSNVYNPPTFNFPATTERHANLQLDPRIRLDHHQQHDLQFRTNNDPSQLPTRHLSEIEQPQYYRHARDIPSDYRHGNLQHRPPYFITQPPVQSYVPMQQQHPFNQHHPAMTHFIPQPQGQQYPHNPQYYHRPDSVDRTASLPHIPPPFAAHTQHHLKDIVQQNPISARGQKSSKEFFRKRDSSSSEDSSDLEKPLLENSIYGDGYLKSLMKEVRPRVQESSDANFTKLCFLLEVDCCASKTNGTDPYICDPLDSLLLTNFINNTAPWLDVYCSSPLFSQYLPQVSLCEDPSMMYNCLLSCGALFLHRDRPEKFDLKFALKYYNSALKLLSMRILQSDRVLPVCLICSILLNHYEDFAGEMQNKFNHHAGSRVILQEILNSESNHKKRKSKSSGTKQVDLGKLNSLENNELLESTFWVITNNDLQETLKWEVPSRWSLQNPNTTVLSLVSNIDYDEKISEYISNFFDIDFKRVGFDFFNEKDDIWWLRKSAYNLQLISNYLFQTYVISHREYAENSLIQKWIELKKMNDNYGKFLPGSLRKIAYLGGIEESEFPEIKFKDETAAIINLNYHLSCLLLYDSLMKRTQLFSEDVDEASRASRVFSEEDKEYLTNKRNLKNLLKHHSISIMGILKSYHGNNIVWSLNLGHFKIALRFLKRYSEFHKELDSLIKDIQEYTKMRFNRI